ncbi:class I SAM-dependent methyltransferase [Streptomyces sp. NPDC101166]|uniref:class I SAM-dependent methyltransferase n=1 Tax=Streptomyces sp. NPDC101166 TaxID=3366120 RepID=UPI0037F5E33A
MKADPATHDHGRAAADPAADSTLMDAAYSGVYGEIYRTHWWWRAREHQVLHYVGKHGRWNGRRAKILDVGCGDGFIWRRLEPFGDVEGIEPDRVLVAPDSPRRSRIEVADFAQGRPRGADHDLVLMLDVLEHIDDQGAALRRVASLLGPDGRGVITVPALTALWSEFDELSGHFRRYTRASLRAALESAGLRVLEMRYYYAWTVLPLFLRRLLFKAEASEHSHFVKAPARPVNHLMYGLSRLDHWLTRRLPAPAGSSLIAVVARDV